MLFGMFVVFPLTLMVWRGVWGIIDEYITAPPDAIFYRAGISKVSLKNSSSEDPPRNAHPCMYLVKNISK